MRFEYVLSNVTLFPGYQDSSNHSKCVPSTQHKSLLASCVIICVLCIQSLSASPENVCV